MHFIRHVTDHQSISNPTIVTQKAQGQNNHNIISTQDWLKHTDAIEAYNIVISKLSPTTNKIPSRYVSLT